MNKHLKNHINQLLPFLNWWGDFKKPGFLLSDLLAGITVSMLLIPQAMAYAQLIQLPVNFGLYSALVPPLFAALFGSFRQLSTGPVAVVALLTVAAVEPLAIAGTPEYLAYVIFLSLLVGLVQLLLGFMRLGIVLNFISHPVLLGFINATAVIIATSQLGKFLGVSVPKASHHYQTVWSTLVEALTNLHVPTLMMSLCALLIMFILKKYKPSWPNIIIAVIVTTLIAWFFRFERVQLIRPANITNPTIQKALQNQANFHQDAKAIKLQIKEAQSRYKTFKLRYGDFAELTINVKKEISGLKVKLAQRVAYNEKEKGMIGSLRLVSVIGDIGKASRYYEIGNLPEDENSDGIVWKITGVDSEGQLILHAGGQVVGFIPKGLPALKLPLIDGLSGVLSLIISAFIIAFIGFMEAITIARRMAATTKQRLDINQELVGQGMANISGSLFQSYPVSGSFARSALNLETGAKSGYSSVFAMLIVMLTLLFLTPLLYYVPQATLAAIIIYVVVGLLNFKAIYRTWKVSNKEGMVSITTFFMTLFFAPHLEYGIFIGVIMSLGFYLQETMRPRFSEVSKTPKGVYTSVKRLKLPTCKFISIVRFYGSLYFANASYFEGKVMQVIAKKPATKFVVIDCVSINKIDSSGLEAIETLYEQLEKAKVLLYFTNVRFPVLEAMKRGGLINLVKEDSIYPDNNSAVTVLEKKCGGSHMKVCPLSKY